VDAAITLFQWALKEDPNYALAHAGLGRSYWLKYDASKEREWVETARQACERAVSLDAKLAAGHNCLGTLYNGTGQYEKAVAQFQGALESEPTSDDAYVGLAHAYELLGQLESAEQTYRKAIELRPAYWASYSWLGRFYFSHGRYEKSGEMFRRVTLLTPDNKWGYTGLGANYYMRGHPDQAVEMYRRALEIAPDAIAYSNLGVAYFFTQHYGESARMFEKGVELQPQDYRLWGNLADAYRWTPGEENRARKTYERAIALAQQQLEVNPRDAGVLGSLAQYHAKIGSHERARQLIGQAVAIAPKDLNLLLKAAEVYNLADNHQEALEWLKRVVQAGYPRFEIEANPEFANLRDHPEFRKMTAGSKPAP
jgi:tetratricopeptide (TPR) repeat protein